jgi:four helix bundle protein
LRFLRHRADAQNERTAYFLRGRAEVGLISAGIIRAPESSMTPQQLQVRTKRFAIDVIRFSRKLPRTEEARVIGRQLLRAGTSLGANYRAVCRAKTDADFIYKLGVCVEESDEAAYWVEILAEAEIVSTQAGADLLGEATQLTRIFVASRETVRARVRRKNRTRARN